MAGTSLSKYPSVPPLPGPSSAGYPLPPRRRANLAGAFDDIQAEMPSVSWRTRKHYREDKAAALHAREMGLIAEESRSILTRTAQDVDFDIYVNAERISAQQRELAVVTARHKAATDVAIHETELLAAEYKRLADDAYAEFGRQADIGRKAGETAARQVMDLIESEDAHWTAGLNASYVAAIDVVTRKVRAIVRPSLNALSNELDQLAVAETVGHAELRRRLLVTTEGNAKLADFVDWVTGLSEQIRKARIGRAERVNAIETVSSSV